VKESGSTVAFDIKDTEEDKENTVTVSEITTRHLRRLQQSASDYLGKQVTAAVVTIPSDFTDAQKSALTEAAKATNLEILQYISEPVSSLLAYDARPEAVIKDKIVVVADLGSTRSDIAVVASRGGMYTVLATAHDYELGGAQLDQVLIDYAAKEFMKKNKTDPRQNEKSLAKLKAEAEAVKKSLSIGTSAAFSIESLADGNDFSLTVNRTRYELLANKVFGSFTRLIEGAVKKAGLDPLDVGEIILAGGSSHTPKVARNLQSAFPERVTVMAPSTSAAAINPSELASRGAAIQASLIAEFEKEDVEQSTHPAVTVTPHLKRAIGIATVAETINEEVFETLIDAETPIPVRRTVQIPVSKDGDVLVKLCEGVSSIKVTKPEPKANGAKDDDDDEDDDDDDDEEEEMREKIWSIGDVLAEAAVKGAKKGGKVEVQVSIGADLAVQLLVREVGGKGGVRGSLEGSTVASNGA